MIRQILEFIKDDLSLEIHRDEVQNIVEEIETTYSDFYADIDGNEYRFIHSDYIWEIYVESIKELAEDCYDINVPSWLAIDWEETAQNCIVDGYGQTFAHYDHEEHEVKIGNEDYHVFRTN